MEEKTKNSLKVSLVEFNMAWENPKVNLEYLDKILKDHQSDLILLPEMFSTGFSMNPEEIAEEPLGESYKWMKSKAVADNCAVVGSIPTREDGKFFNRLYFVSPTETSVYDKKHLFGYGKETDVYSAGNEIVNAHYLGWKFRLIVCYDLRFPAWCRNTDEYDVLLCPASWPAVRMEPWKALLKARAIENISYSIGINRLGVDGYKLEYNGNSKIYNPIGEEVPTHTTSLSILQTEISKEEIYNYREKYRFLEDRDEFSIHS